MSVADAQAQFEDFRVLDERDLNYLLDKIVHLQAALIDTNDRLLEMRRRELDRERPS